MNVGKSEKRFREFILSRKISSCFTAEFTASTLSAKEKFPQRQLRGRDFHFIPATSISIFPRVLRGASIFIS